jgi:hypothetical protein
MKSNGEVVIRVGRLTWSEGARLDSLRRAGRCRRASRLTQALFNKHGTTPHSETPLTDHVLSVEEICQLDRVNGCWQES